MSNRIGNINVNSTGRLANGPIIVSRDIDEIISFTSTGSLAAGATNADFSPEASVIVPQATSVAAITAKVFNVLVTAGSITFAPFAPNGVGYYPLGATITAPSSLSVVQRYPRGLISLARMDSLHIVYTTSANYSGPSGTAGFRIGLWVYE